MNVFLDTSTLFKLYHEEEGTDEIDRFLEEQEIDRIYISEIAEVEFIRPYPKDCERERSHASKRMD